MSFKTERQRKFFFANLGKLSSGQKRKIGFGLGLATLGLGLFLGRKTRGVRAISSGIRRGAGRVAKQKNVRRIIRRGSVAKGRVVQAVTKAAKANPTTRMILRKGSVAKIKSGRKYSATKTSVKNTINRTKIQIRRVRSPKRGESLNYTGRKDAIKVVKGSGRRHLKLTKTEKKQVDFLTSGGVIKKTKRKGSKAKAGEFNPSGAGKKYKKPQQKKINQDIKAISIKNVDTARRLHSERMTQLKAGGVKNPDVRAWKSVIDADQTKAPLDRVIPNQITLNALTTNKQVHAHFKKTTGALKAAEKLKKNTAIKELDGLVMDNRGVLLARPISLSKAGPKIRARVSGEQEMVAAVAQSARRGLIPKSAVADATKRLKTIDDIPGTVVKPKPLSSVLGDEVANAKAINKHLSIDIAKMQGPTYRNVRKLIRQRETQLINSVRKDAIKAVKNAQVNRASGKLNKRVSNRIKKINTTNLYESPEYKSSQIQKVVGKKDSVLLRIKQTPLSPRQTDRVDSIVSPVVKSARKEVIEGLKIRRLTEKTKQLEKVKNDLAALPRSTFSGLELQGQRSQAINALTRSAEQKVAARAQKSFESQITSGSTHTIKKLGLEVKPDGTVQYIRLSEQSVPGISPASKSTKNIQVVTARQSSRKKNIDQQERLALQAEKEAKERIKIINTGQKKQRKTESMNAIDSLEERTKKLLKDLDKL